MGRVASGLTTPIIFHSFSLFFPRNQSRFVSHKLRFPLCWSRRLSLPVPFPGTTSNALLSSSQRTTKTRKRRTRSSKAFSASSSCNAGEEVCMQGQVTECVNGKFVMTPVRPLQCVALPYLERGTYHRQHSITWDTQQDANTAVSHGCPPRTARDRSLVHLVCLLALTAIGLFRSTLVIARLTQC